MVFLGATPARRRASSGGNPYDGSMISPRNDDALRESTPDAELAPSLDRHAMLRTDLAWIEAAMWDDHSRFLVLDGQDVLFESDTSPHPRFLTRSELGPLELKATAAVLLGVSGDVPVFAMDVAETSSEVRDRLAGIGTFVSMRSLNPSVSRATWEMIAQARSLSRWNKTSRYCPTCGAPMIAGDAGYVRRCSNSDCPTVKFPRVDPAIIVRILFEDRCLLARQSKFSPGLRSVIAGFVEPGETLEAAVEREIQEEVGLIVQDITYVASQPWPFPQALMVGFVARALTPEIRIDHREIESADWYTRTQVQQELSEGTLILPGRRSIARRLIDDWLLRPG